MNSSNALLLKQIGQCRICEKHLPLGPRPIVRGHPSARILVIGQAPGLNVHQTGIPWNDASGDRLREWLGLSREDFYNPDLVAIMPMGFCYPGRAKSGDAPPRRECFEHWHTKFISSLKEVQLTLLIGNYAQKKYLGSKNKINATETIRSWKEYLPQYIPLPHSSPRNNIWLSKNQWFIKTLPEIQKQVLKALRS